MAPTTQPTVETTEPAAGQQLTFVLVSGSVVVDFQPGGVSLVWARPDGGADVEVSTPGDGLRVEFESDTHRSRIEVWWDNGPQWLIRESPRGDSLDD